jgi:2-methylcitrate dehydratase PrpD
MEVKAKQEVPMDYTRQLALFVSQTEFGHLPLDVIQKCKLLILDTLGCAFGGYTLAHQQVSWILELVKSQGCEGPSTCFVEGLKTSSAYAALANGTMVHTIDFDDTHMGSIAHLSSALVATTFALGEQLKSKGTEVIAAFILGFEVAARIGRCVMPSHYKYWHPTATLGLFASAVAAAKLFRLDFKKIEMVIGHAGDQAGGLRYGIEKGDFSKTLHPGFAAMKGILLASLVNLGADGPKGILEYPSGFSNAYSTEPKMETILAGLGTSYEVMQDSIKSFPTIQCSHTAIEATLKIMNKFELRAEEIDRIQIVQSETVKGQGCNYSPDTPLGARLSIPYCVALAVFEKRVAMDQFSFEELSDSKIRNMMSRITIVQDPTLNLKYPETLASFVDIRLNNGETFSDSAIYPKGDPKHRMTSQEIKEKFRGLAANTFGSDEIERIIEAVEDLLKVADISEVVRLLIKK